MKLELNNFIDLTVTSPPYDDVRTYKGFTLPLKEIATELQEQIQGGASISDIIHLLQQWCDSSNYPDNSRTA